MTEQAADRGRHLKRFFSRLMSERAHLEADAIVFEKSSGATEISLSRKGARLKSYTMAPEWHEPMQKWLADRVALEGLSRARDEQAARKKSAASSHMIHAGAHSWLFTLAASGKGAFELSDFSLLPGSAITETLAWSPVAQRVWSEVVGATQGVLVIAAPDRENLRRTVSALLALGAPPYLGEGESKDVIAAVAAAKAEYVSVGIVAEDPVAALGLLAAGGINFAKVSVTGVLCQTFARANCAGCLAPDASSADAVTALPAGLRPPPGTVFQHGTGCERCADSGYRGIVGLQSFASFLSIGSATLAASDAALTETLYRRGVRPLVVDGLRKAVAGRTTLEAVIAAVSLPARWAAFYASPAHEGSQQFQRALLNERWQPPAGPESSSTASGAFAADDRLFSPGPIAAEKAAPGSVRGKILVVEDDRDQRSILEIVLKSAGYQISVANHGKEGLAMLAKERPDLIMSDLMMPVMDGSEFVQEVRARAEYGAIPILMLTVVSDQEREYSLLEMGADDYCDKTIQRKLLLKRIERLLARSRIVNR